MKIKKNDLQQIIKEEAFRLFQIEKLEEAKKAVDENIKLISEGKKKMSNEELDELWAGLKNVLGKGAQKVQQIGQNVAKTYKKGETDAKIASLQKQKIDLTTKLQGIDSELTKLIPPAPKKKIPARSVGKTPVFKSNSTSKS